jgi:hypothetical protein
MSFMQNQGWRCQFLEADLKTPLPRKLTFSSPDKILQLAEHAGALKDLAARQAIEHGIDKGRGGVYLMLTPEQYAKLRPNKTPETHKVSASPIRAAPGGGRA